MMIDSKPWWEKATANLDRERQRIITRARAAARVSAATGEDMSTDDTGDTQDTETETEGHGENGMTTTQGRGRRGKAVDESAAAGGTSTKKGPKGTPAPLPTTGTKSTASRKRRRGDDGTEGEDNYELDESMQDDDDDASQHPIKRGMIEQEEGIAPSGRGRPSRKSLGVTSATATPAPAEALAAKSTGRKRM